MGGRPSRDGPEPAILRVTGTGPDPAVATRPNTPAKFAIPLATHVVEHPRLLARVAAGVSDGVTLTAPAAGWGKSLLVGLWAAGGADGRRAAWVNLDPGDDDVRSFWATTAAALATVARDRAAAEALARLAAAPTGGELPGDLVRALERSDHPFVLVLDNLHEVTDPDVHAGLQRLVERPPRMLSLVVTTRRDPPWPLPRLRLAGLLTEIGADDLAFRPDEGAALFARFGVELTAEELDEMVQRTDGWAAGMRLGALHLHEAPDVRAAVATFSGDDHDVSVYLLDEVLARLPTDLVGFLQKISVVDLVCVDLADALTGRGDAAAVLGELAASHLFVHALDRPGRWYRLHRLLLDCSVRSRSPAGNAGTCTGPTKIAHHARPGWSRPTRRGRRQDRPGPRPEQPRDRGVLDRRARDGRGPPAGGDRPDGPPTLSPPVNAASHLALIPGDRGDLVTAEQTARAAVRIAERGLDEDDADRPGIPHPRARGVRPRRPGRHVVGPPGGGGGAVSRAPRLARDVSRARRAPRGDR